MERKLTLTEDQIADLKEAFSVFDQDGNGTITPLELETLMKSVLGDDPFLQDQVQSIIRSVDDDNSGSIDFDEFLTLMSDPKYNIVKDEHREVFGMFDKDGSGHISVAELKDAFRALGQRLDDNEFDAILQEADLNGDMHIDYQEFLQMMKR